MSRLTRKEMKRDPVREALARGLGFLSENAKRIGIGLVVLAVLLLGASLGSRYFGGRHSEASDALAEAMQVQGTSLRSELSPGVTPTVPVYDTAEERAAELRRRYEELIADYPRAPAARHAKSLLASLELEAGRTAEARALWAELAQSGSDDALTAQVILNLNELDRREGKLAEVEERLLGMVDNPNSAVPQDLVLAELAATQEELGKLEESRTTYQRIVDEHPTSPQARQATEKVAAADSA